MYRINEALPVKYHFMVHTAMPKYPSHSDFIFDVCAYLVRVHGSKNKDISAADLKFSAKTLKYIFGEQVNSDDFRQTVKSIVADCLEDGSLSKKGEFIFISETTFTKYFSIV
jgi:hypothetical protein